MILIFCLLSRTKLISLTLIAHLWIIVFYDATISSMFLLLKLRSTFSLSMIIYNFLYFILFAATDLMSSAQQEVAT